MQMAQHVSPHKVCNMLYASLNHFSVFPPMLQSLTRSSTSTVDFKLSSTGEWGEAVMIEFGGCCVVIFNHTSSKIKRWLCRDHNETLAQLLLASTHMSWHCRSHSLIINVAPAPSLLRGALTRGWCCEMVWLNAKPNRDFQAQQGV